VTASYWGISETVIHFVVYEYLKSQLAAHQVRLIHGRSDKPGYGANWKKIARFEKLENFSSVFQYGLAFLGRSGKVSFSEFPEIYDSLDAESRRGLFINDVTVSEVMVKDFITRNQ
jgi:hypothetical protein